MTEALDSDARSYVVFRLGSEEYGIAIERVQSIIRYEEPTPVPRAPGIVQGVINMRGRVIPVIDLSKRLKGTQFTPSAHARIVVAESEAGLLGLAVDAASEVASIPLTAVQPAPDGVLSPETASAITGVAEREGRLVVLLDLDETVPRATNAHTTDTGQTGTEGEVDV